MASETEKIERFFNDYFATWRITLPAEAIAQRSSGHLFERGWHIGFIWGKEDGEEYLEFLAQHSLTNDRHHRVFASGRVEDLPAPSDMFVIPAGASEAESERIHQAHQEEESRILAELQDKGLLPD
jgi:hypothetical protein